MILGGALMDLAARDTAAAALLDRLVRSLPRDQDRKAFEGWNPEMAARAVEDAGMPPAPPNSDNALRPDNPGHDP